MSDWSSDVCSSDLLLNDRPGGTEMGQLTTVEAANWMALYLATGICCAMAFALSIGMMLCVVYRERSWTAVTSWQAALLFVPRTRSEEHTSELQSLMRISYAVFCLKKKQNKQHSKRESIQ